MCGLKKLLQLILIFVLIAVVISNSADSDAETYSNTELYYAIEEVPDSDVAVTLNSKIIVNDAVISVNINMPTSVVPIAISDSYYVDYNIQYSSYTIHYYTSGVLNCMSNIKEAILCIDNHANVLRIISAVQNGGGN